MTQRSFELVNDYYFKLLNLGIICYAAKTNYYKNRYQSAAIKKKTNPKTCSIDYGTGGWKISSQSLEEQHCQWIHRPRAVNSYI